MNALRWTVPLLALMIAPGANAAHIPLCVPTSPDPASVNTIDLTPVGGPIFYDEERGNPFGTPIPLTGFLFGPDSCDAPLCSFLEGQGSWIYEETNGLESLQRGGFNALWGEWFPPGCDQNPDWQPTDGTVPCLFRDVDPITDESCGHGPDRRYF